MAKIIGRYLSNIPWQEPDGTEKLPIWRYKDNPIIDRFATKNSNSIFNSAVVPYEDGFAGVFRCDSRSISMDILAKTASTGRSPMSRLNCRVRARKWRSGISAMIRECVS